MTSQQHALYRFFDPTGALLYIGVTLDPGARWKSHSKSKPWWTDVAQVTVELHPTRPAVLEAERAAIIAEKPLHNIVHNRGTSEAPRLVAQTERLMPMQVGDWVALGLKDGRCPVGEISATDEQWIAIRRKEFLMGSLTNQIQAFRWEEIQRVELAYLEDAEPGHFGREMDDRHLGEFQTAWHQVHFGDGRDPVEMALLKSRQREAEGSRG